MGVSVLLRQRSESFVMSRLNLGQNHFGSAKEKCICTDFDNIYLYNLFLCKLQTKQLSVIKWEYLSKMKTVLRSKDKKL